MNVLVTGGAGYIGTHVIKNLLTEGHQVICYDNLSGGFQKPIDLLKKNDSLKLIEADLADKEKLAAIFSGYRIDTVIHLAAKINAAESVLKPEIYFRENYNNSINLMEAMLDAGVSKIVFASTAAVYGNPKYTPIDENHPVNPINPYGQSKLDFERYLAGCKNLKYVILRFFNVGGSDSDGLIGKSHIGSTDIIEAVISTALGQQNELKIFGSDYPTLDGTAIRDMVHVEDIAQANVLALHYLNRLDVSSEIFNLGSEKGFSIKDILIAAEEIIGKKLPVTVCLRREGDIAVSIASSTKAEKILGWKKEYSNLRTIIQTDWEWRKLHPLGYK